MHAPEYSIRLKKILHSDINTLEHRMKPPSVEQLTNHKKTQKSRKKKKHCSYTIVSLFTKHNKTKTKSRSSQKKHVEGVNE